LPCDLAADPELVRFLLGARLEREASSEDGCPLLEPVRLDEISSAERRRRARTFSVKATDQAGNTGTPATRTWTQVPSLPPGGSATFSWSTCKVAVYAAVVDRTQAVSESNESNNTASLRNSCT
jgi:hypothetical protein